MKIYLLLPIAIGWMIFICTASATTFYVDVNSANPTPPYAGWSTASTDIQDAIDAAVAGDLVLVTNGVYAIGGRSVNGNALSNRVALTKPLSVQSVNGPAVTVIQGYQVPGTTNGDSAVRCAYLTNGASLVGFTLEGGATRSVANGSADGIGGGIWCESLNAFVTNCVIVGNASGYAGGGAYQGTFTACVLSNNFAIQGRGFGGGAYKSTLMKSVLVGNVAYVDGSGADACTLYNCLLYSNNPAGANSSVLVNCTVANNIGMGVTYTTILTNCIVYNNSVGIGSGFYAFCCVSSLPARGIGNFTNSPLFVNPASGDYHLQFNSPCINAGNNFYVSGTNDLDGNPRIQGGTVDIGCYEYQTPASIISYAWLQQYGLPTDGTADYADSDGDGMKNYAEWKAGTNPTNAASVLALQSPAATNSVGITVTWQSVSGITYYLQSSTNFPAFTSIQSNLVGQAGTTSFTDTTATNGGPYFYRVGVQ
jgi:Bacterial TSP3 repeat